MVYEIKELIKETKDDTTDPVRDLMSDALSEKVTQYQQRRRQVSNMTGTEDSLMSAMTQLAWIEKDIDLGEGRSSLRQEDIPEEEMKMENVSREEKVVFVNMGFVGESSTDDVAPLAGTLVVENVDEVPLVEKTEDTRVVPTCESGTLAEQVDKHRSAREEGVAERPPTSSKGVLHEAERQLRKKLRKKKKRSSTSAVTKDGNCQDHSDMNEQAAELPHFSPPSSSSSMTCLLKTPEDT